MCKYHSHKLFTNGDGQLSQVHTPSEIVSIRKCLLHFQKSLTTPISAIMGGEGGFAQAIGKLAMGWEVGDTFGFT